MSRSVIWRINYVVIWVEELDNMDVRQFFMIDDEQLEFLLHEATLDQVLQNFDFELIRLQNVGYYTCIVH